LIPSSDGQASDVTGLCCSPSCTSRGRVASARAVHREPLTISRWERGEDNIDSNAEVLIRICAIENLNLTNRATVEVEQTSDPSSLLRPSAAVGDHLKPLRRRARRPERSQYRSVRRRMPVLWPDQGSRTDPGWAGCERSPCPFRADIRSPYFLASCESIPRIK
jgi:hypothetical protein